MRIHDATGRLVAITLVRSHVPGIGVQREGVLDRAGLLTLSRFINGYPNGWMELTTPGQQITLLSWPLGGHARYEEARALFRRAWEAWKAGGRLL